MTVSTQEAKAMNLENEVEHRLAKWVFFNLYREEEIDRETYHLLIETLIAECDPPMQSIEERFDMSEREES
jgi:hypothetical protein